MKGWGHVTTMREVVRREDSPVGRCNTRAEEIREETADSRQVNGGQLHHREE